LRQYLSVVKQTDTIGLAVVKANWFSDSKNECIGVKEGETKISEEDVSVRVWWANL
jgi:hypothetical protein